MKLLCKRCSPFLILTLLIFGCKTSDDDSAKVSESSLNAAIAETCITTINFEDFEGDVYAYRADEFFNVPSVQSGGHSTENESTDLGANIFAHIPLLDNIIGTFTVDGATTMPGTAYIYYIDGNGNEYISTNTNTSLLTVESIDISTDGMVINSITFSFNNVEVANNTDPNDILCINAFRLVYEL